MSAEVAAELNALTRAGAHVANVSDSATTITPSPSKSLEWITAAEAAVILGVSDRRVRALSRQLQSGHKVKGVWRFLRDDVLEEAEARAAE